MRELFYSWDRETDEVWPDPTLASISTDSEEDFNAHRRVAVDELTTPYGVVKVSTVFLVIDHGWKDKPVLFETMIFGGIWEDNQWRYHTGCAALAGHKRIVEAIKQGEDVGALCLARG